MHATNLTEIQCTRHQRHTTGFSTRPILRKNCSEYQTFDEVLEKSVTEDIVFMAPTRFDENRTEEVEHTIRGMTPRTYKQMQQLHVLKGVIQCRGSHQTPLKLNIDVVTGPTEMTDSVQVHTSNTKLEVRLRLTDKETSEKTRIRRHGIRKHVLDCSLHTSPGETSVESTIW